MLSVSYRSINVSYGRVVFVLGNYKITSSVLLDFKFTAG